MTTVPPEHPLAQEIRRNKIRLWELVTLLGGKPSQTTLSRMLSGIQPIPQELEARLIAILYERRKEQTNGK